MFEKDRKVGGWKRRHSERRVSIAADLGMFRG